jgi:diaminohydroxyphosphoribosylaminopyrimidine deaminase/5-amino-6-(5-phosphoribosylamino)uracil reductase
MDKKYMLLALELAAKGKYGVKSNPMVGCVIVKNNEVIARGYHEKFGENHAEINALEQINFDAKNCDIYVTLEPCSHFGKTPPCVDAIIKAQPRRVIIASLDPNPQVSSVEKMQKMGIEVITGVLEQEAITLNKGFFKRMQIGLPYVICKLASSIDGKIAMADGKSKWISNEKSRADVQNLRASVGAIISSSATVLADNPHFNVRDSRNSPIKVILDKNQQITDKNLNIFSGEKVIITQDEPQQILKSLAKKEINQVLIEAGGVLSAKFLEFIDELIIYQAPIIMGKSAKPMFNLDIQTMSDKINLKLKSIKQFDDDLKITYVKQ